MNSGAASHLKIRLKKSGSKSSLPQPSAGAARIVATLVCDWNEMPLEIIAVLPSTPTVGRAEKIQFPSAFKHAA